MIWWRSPFPDTQYSKWYLLPEDRDTLIEEIVENKRFQVRTDKKIDTTNDIRWLLGGNVWLTFSAGLINAAKCNGGYHSFTGNEGFFQKPGVLTFLKTSTQLQVWFDDILEVTWVYQDNSDTSLCAMRILIRGLKFRAPRAEDTVSSHYRYETGTVYVTLVWINHQIVYNHGETSVLWNSDRRANFRAVIYGKMVKSWFEIKRYGPHFLEFNIFLIF